MPINDCPVQRSIWYDSHNAAMSSTRTFFGEANTAILGIGKTTMRDDCMLGATLMLQQGVFSCQGSLPASTLHQHHASSYISSRKDVRCCRAQIVVDHNIAALAPHVRR